MTDVSAAQDVEDMRDLVIEAGHGEPTVERMLFRASEKLGLNLSKTRSIYHRKARRIDAYQYVGAQRRMEMVRLRQLEAKRQQVAVLEAQYGHDRDALKAKLSELAGPYLQLLEKLGVVEKGAARIEEDGEG